MKNIIEINGRKYDTVTGKLIDKVTPINTINTQKSSTNTQVSGVIIDGVSRRKPKSNHTINLTNLVANKINPVHKPVSLNSIDLRQNTSRNTEKTKTLIRGSVKKPKSMLANDQNNITPIVPSNNFLNLIKRVSIKREEKAKSTPKNTSITKFSASSYSEPKMDLNLEVTKPPSKMNFLGPTPIFGRLSKSKPEPAKEQVFSHRIIDANTHSSPKLKKEKLHKRIANKIRVNPKFISVGAACLAIMFLVSFLVYQNIPSVAMRVAANKAGFNGHLPNNIPSGFAFTGPINASRGSIVINYKSNSDDRKFYITQKSSDWSSESLLTNYLMTSNLRYQTYHDKGLTVFIYGGGNATWVDKGIWYQLAGKGSLSSDQILALAGSM